MEGRSRLPPLGFGCWARSLLSWGAIAVLVLKGSMNLEHLIYPKNVNNPKLKDL